MKMVTIITIFYTWFFTSLYWSYLCEKAREDAYERGLKRDPSKDTFSYTIHILERDTK